ncbi:MAG TPA: PQQ-dependent sugar dehydrogenase [Propionibacteriaceae bacterium]|nr:PQQ-dependent sugar dehydrogenase [Propionibacteriaceae bacterium]
MTLHRRQLLLSAGLLAGGTVVGCSNADNAPDPSTQTAGPELESPSPTSPRPTGSASTTASSQPSNSPKPSPSEVLGEPVATDVVTGLTTPWALVPLRDGDMLVCERDTATIKQVVGSRATAIAEIADVVPGGEGGLLGLTATPDERTVFAYFTAANENRIVAMTWDGNRLGSPRTILDGIPKGGRHNGGRMVIGPDRALYVGTGETGDPSLAQDKDSLAGKILRITPLGRPVDDNPFGNEIYSYGHRNVQGLAFDPAGRLWASEFGEQTWDELNLIRRGANYGWPRLEGSGRIDGLVNPKVVWRTRDASPSGLAYWKGSLYMAALRGRRLWEIPIDGTEAGRPRAHFTSDYGRLRSVIVAADGQSLLLTTSNTDGRGDVQRGDDRILRVTR